MSATTQATTAKRARTTNANKPAKAPSATLVAQITAAATTTPAPAAKPAKAPRAMPAGKLVIAKQFKPRTDQLVAKKAEGKGNFSQQHNWDALVAAITAAGGAIDYAAAVAAVQTAGEKGGYAATCNARGFVQGRVRNGHLKAA